MSGTRGKWFWLILLLAGFSLAALGAGPPRHHRGGPHRAPGQERLARPAAPTAGHVAKKPTDGAGSPTGSGRPESLSGSTVSFYGETDPNCFVPGVETTLCFQADSYTVDDEYVYGLALRFPEGWVITDVNLEPYVDCTSSFGFSWDEVTPWHTLGGPNEIFLDFYLGSYEDVTHCTMVFCITMIPGAGGACDVPVSWYWNPEFYSSPPHVICSSDAWAPEEWAPCQEAVQPPALVPACSGGEPGLCLRAQPQVQQECPGYTATYSFTVTNNYPEELAVPLALADNAWPAAAAPNPITVPAGGSATFDLTHVIPVVAAPGDFDPVTVTALDPLNPPLSPVATVTSSVRGEEWDSIPDSYPPWYLWFDVEEYYWPGCGCTAQDAAGHWVTYTMHGPDDYMAGFWGYDHDDNQWVWPAPQNLPDLRYDYAFAYDPTTNLCYLTGGYGYEYTLDDAWVYDPVANAFTQLPYFDPPRGDHMSWVGTIGSDRYLCIGGGWDNSGQTDSTQCYDLANFPGGSWEGLNNQMGPIPDGPLGESATATLYDPAGDQFWLAGGYEESTYLPTDRAYYFNGFDGTWYNVGPTGYPRDCPGGAFYNGTFYQLGGFEYYEGWDITDTAIRYTGTGWEEIPPMPHERGNPTVGVSPEFLTVVDGYSYYSGPEPPEPLADPGRPGASPREEKALPTWISDWVDILETCKSNCPQIAVTPTTLSAATFGQAYSVTFGATPAGTYTWSYTGTLPAGLTLTPEGILSGTPTELGSFPIAVTAEDEAGCTKTVSFPAFAVDCYAILVTPATLAPATVGQPYSATFSADPPGTYAFYLDGTLPAGMGFADGILSGTPTETGTFAFTVTAEDELGCTGSVTIDPFEIQCPPISLEPAGPHLQGTIGVYFEPVFTPVGGTGPYSFSLTGTLPPGLTSADNGSTFWISGTPGEVGRFPITLEFTDVYGCTGAGSYEIQICPVITLTPGPALPSGEINVPYSLTFAAAGGTAPYTYAVTAGALPPGLVLSPAGVLSGSPTVDGMAGFAVTATDAEGCAGSQYYSLYICPKIYFDPNPWTLPNALLGQPYSFQLGGAGGTAPYALSVIQNSLPPGLSIGGYCYPNRAVGGPEGLICGIPTATGNYGFTLQLTDAMGCSTTRWFEIYVCSPITVGPASLPSGKVGTAYSKTFTATGGTAPYAFSLTYGILPVGLTLNASTGVLSGTPTAAGMYEFMVTATDKWGCQGSAYYSLIVCGTVTLSPNSPLPGGQAGVPYSQQITATGGGGALAYAIAAGILPPGITLATDTGLLSGTPLYGGTYSFTVKATFEGICTGTKAYTIAICPVITVNPATLPAGKKGTLYSKILTGAGGTAPYTFSLAGGALPTGLTLAAGTGKLSGYPTAAGTYNFTVRARDSKGCNGTRAYTVVINP